MSRHRPGVAPLAGAALALAAAIAPRPAPALTTVRVASGLALPVYAASPPGDARLYILEQRGRVRLLTGAGLAPTPFLDIDSLVVDLSFNDERGLLGLAFHPQFPDSAFFYVNYVDNANRTVIARYRPDPANPERADHGSALVLLAIPQPYANHKGGTLGFGPDGYLYVGMGDGGSGGDPQNRAQNPAELLGKMLRLDVSRAAPGLGYAIPPDNPFVDDPSYRPEIWSLGFRNPYRWSFDRQTGDLWIADVGQNSWEEIDYQPAASRGGENWGWRLMEGAHCFNPPTDCGSDTLELPLHEYPNDAARCAVTGGVVYRGEGLPALQGAYLFADFCSRQIWTLRQAGGVVTELVERTAELAPGGGLTLGNIAAIVEDGVGEVFLVDRGSGSDGELYKIVDATSGVPPAGPAGFALGEPAPNPFAAGTSFAVTLERPGRLEVEILDAAGRRVTRLFSGVRPAGRYALAWDGTDGAGRRAAPGVYFLRAALDGRALTRTLSRVR